MTDKNALGDRGEAIFQLALTELVGPNKSPYFRAKQLGEKWPVTDFFCQIEGKPGYGFLVQAKATLNDIGKSTLPISTISQQKIEKLCKSPMPSYLVAVHEPSQQVYIGVPNSIRSISSVPITYLLHQTATLDLLKQEVEQYWNAQPIQPFDSSKSKFSF
jgi:hypothetical protein